MSESYILKAETRGRVGKGAARAVRRNGGIPAVLYGNKQEPSSITLDPRELSIFINKFQMGIYNHIVTLEIDGKEEKGILRDLQLDLIKDLPIHVDFLRVGAHTRLTLHVPLHLEGIEKSKAIKRGGVLNVVRSDIEVRCTSDAIPENLVLKVPEDAEIGHTFRFSEVELPKGVKPTIKDRDFVVATIVAPKIVKDDEDEEVTDATEETPEEETK